VSEVKDWVNQGHKWLSFFPAGHPDHDKPFSDSPFHTGFWATGLILNKKIVPNDFLDGYLERVYSGFFYRTPGIYTPMNRDQFLSLALPLEYVIGYPKDLIEKHVGPLWPHQWMHFQRSANVKRNYLLRLVCDLFDCADSIVDFFSDSESSKVHNILRHAIADFRFPTFLSRTAKWLFLLHVDPWQVMWTYFRRNPDGTIPHDVIHPPINIEWDPILNRMYK